MTVWRRQPENVRNTYVCRGGTGMRFSQNILIVASVVLLSEAGLFPTSAAAQTYCYWETSGLCYPPTPRSNEPQPATSPGACDVVGAGKPGPGTLACSLDDSHRDGSSANPTATRDREENSKVAESAAKAL